MKQVRALFVMFIASLACSQGQQQEEKPDIEARKRSVAMLEDYIREREVRLGEIASDILRLDDRLEGQITRITAKLASIKDSQKSGYRVSQIKREAMDGLAKTIENYQQKRASLVQELREGRTGIPKEVLEGDIRKFDEHIEKRVEQIIKISKSFTQDANVAKYEKVHGGDYYTAGIGWSDEVEQISEEWRQNRRDRTMNRKQRAEVMAALEKSIQRYETLVAGQKESLANRRMSKSYRALLEADLARNEATLAARQRSLRDFLEVDKPDTSAVSRDAARELQQALRDSAADLRQDFETIFVKYAELNRERSKIAKLRTSLAARKKWLEDHEAEQQR